MRPQFLKTLRRAIVLARVGIASIGGAQTPPVEPERFQFTSADGLSMACVKWSDHQPVREVIANLLVWISGILGKAS